MHDIYTYHLMFCLLQAYGTFFFNNIKFCCYYNDESLFNSVISLSSVLNYCLSVFLKSSCLSVHSSCLFVVVCFKGCMRKVMYINAFLLLVISSIYNRVG